MTGHDYTGPSRRGRGSRLTDHQVAEAQRMWAEGNTLGVIARTVGCGIYDLSPWIYSDTTRQLLARVRAIDELGGSRGCCDECGTELDADGCWRCGLEAEADDELERGSGLL